MNKRTALLWLIGLLVFAGLACNQAGEIVEPAEATARAIVPTREISTEAVEGAELEIGDTATLTGRSFLVNLLDAPDGRIIAGQERGAVVTVLEVVAIEDELWYHVEANTGEGWVTGDNLEVPEFQGPDRGDTVYLTAKGFLVNLLNEPGGLIIAGQERGVEVTVIDFEQQDGELWYLIEAPTGEGWVLAENLSEEAP